MKYFKEADPIYIGHVLGILQYVYTQFFENNHFEFNEIKLIGSGHTKTFSGDLDIAVFNHYPKRWDYSLDHLTYLFKNDKRVLDYHVNRGFKQLSILISNPIDTRKKHQIDLMLVSDLNWATFIYDPCTKTSSFKGSYRNLLLMSIIGNCFYNKINETEYESYSLRLNSGIWKTRKTYQGKRGKLSKAKLLHDYDEFITHDPREMIRLFSNKIVPIDSFESLYDLLMSSHFKFPHLKNSIIKDFMNRLNREHLDYPIEFPINEVIYS